MKKRIFINLLVIVSLLLGLSACTKSSKNATLNVRLTDAPADYQQVLIDIQEVRINASATDDAGWQSLPVRKGVYNLLDFRNGLDTLLSTIDLPAGRISQIRLVLGSGNMIKKDGQWYNLDTPSAMQSGLKLNVQADLSEGVVYDLWIDFDAARSIVERGNGTFSLKPVIRTFTKAISGAIKGVVSPIAAAPVVSAVANGDTITTYAGADGKFLLPGLIQGTYKVIFTPKAPYVGKSVDNVGVTTGVVTDMGTINF